jgi:hypothetical protein
MSEKHIYQTARYHLTALQKPNMFLETLICDRHSLTSLAGVAMRKMHAGKRNKMDCLNNNVKSNPRRHWSTAGPKRSSRSLLQLSCDKASRRLSILCAEFEHQDYGLEESFRSCVQVTQAGKSYCQQIAKPYRSLHARAGRWISPSQRPQRG